MATRGSSSGLGLSIARKVAESVGGTLDAAESPRGEARLEVRIPLC